MRIVTNMKKHALYNFFHKLEFTPCKGEQPPQNMEKKKKNEKKDEKHKRALKRKNSEKKGAF